MTLAHSLDIEFIAQTKHLFNYNVFMLLNINDNCMRDTIKDHIPLI